ncbi:hypothetical protein GCM10009764_52290 [Nocardia ninae]|uniref:Uncharacterized protein n=1 Tax=Nocardia ninae NBRC 108245 TaxID=1210091 RepID=A0A511M655_9NOCA|nr:hypothetical protein NN4_06200 [Nocardia ninae NBRC 108245]
MLSRFLQDQGLPSGFQPPIRGMPDLEWLCQTEPMRDDAGRNLTLERVAHPRESREMWKRCRRDTLRAKLVPGQPVRRGAARRVLCVSPGEVPGSPADPITEVT